MAEQPPCEHYSVYSKVNRVWSSTGRKWAPALSRKGHSLHNQWIRLTIKTEKRKKCKPTCWQALRLKAIRMAGSLRVFAKPTARLHPSGVMKESIISTPSWGKQRKRGQRGRGAASQHLCTDRDPGLVYCCSDEQRSTLIPGSLALSLYLSHCTEAYTHTHTHTHARTHTHTHTHTCIACSYLQPLNAEEHCLNVIATAPILPNLTFIMCRLCYKELFACVM